MTTPLYESLLGTAWTGLAPVVRRLHGGEGRAHGRFRVRRGGVIARAIAALLRMPAAGEGVAVTLAVGGEPETERWTRSFAGQPLCTLQWRQGPLLVEALGLFLCHFRLREDGGALVFEQVGAALGGRGFAIPLPRFLSPKIEGRATAERDGAHVDIEIRAPLVGLVIAYDGIVVPEETP